jgi:hypothetical protein
MIVAVNVGPDRRIAVDVFAAPAVAQERSVALDQNQRLMTRSTPFGHISERMPDEPLVSGNQFGRVPLGHVRRILNLIFSRIKPRRSFSEGGLVSINASVSHSVTSALLLDKFVNRDNVFNRGTPASIFSGNNFFQAQ